MSKGLKLNRFLKQQYYEETKMERTDILLKIMTVDNKTIRLTQYSWKHISERHPEICNRLYDIDEALKQPTAMVRHSEEIVKYYRYLKN